LRLYYLIYNISHNLKDLLVIKWQTSIEELRRTKKIFQTMKSELEEEPALADTSEELLRSFRMARKRLLSSRVSQTPWNQLSSSLS
jgi:hypothetical protein